MYMTQATPLTSSTLEQFAAQVPVPGYDRAAVSVGIVHFGVGGFHRAHEAMYLDRLMNQDEALDWGICGVGVLAGDKRMEEVLSSQDGLYTLIAKHPDGTLEPRVIGSIVRYLFAPEDPEAVLDVLTDESTRIVSLTVTEGGYNFNPVTGEFDETNPGVAADLVPGALPSTVFGFVVEALRRRRASGTAPFAVMSCDNIQGNGAVARSMFSAFADLKDTELGKWLRTEVAFPNSMVDRITPVTAEHDRALLAERYGINDQWPVVCEPFTQWVLEDHFPGGRPRWEDAGVQVVTDVEPYELMKLRLLNASHQAMCYSGYLTGYRYAHEVAADPVFVEFLLRYMRTEASPTLAEVPGVDLAAYQQTLLERFANPEVRDTVARLCAESSDRIPKWLVPVIRANLATGGDIACSATVVASWARYAEGVDEQGGDIVIVDRLRDELMDLARKQRSRPLAFLENPELFGDLAADERFAAAYLDALASFHEVGARRTLEKINTAG